MLDQHMVCKFSLNAIMRGASNPITFIKIFRIVYFRCRVVVSIDQNEIKIKKTRYPFSGFKMKAMFMPLLL